VMKWRRSMPNVGLALPHAADLPQPQPSTEGSRSRTLSRSGYAATTLAAAKG
jgi:hypothetical protein